MTGSNSARAVPAVVLAGGKAKPEIAAATGVENRALVRVNGDTMLGHVTGALKRSGVITRIAVVGDVPTVEGCEHVSDQGEFVANVFAGLAAVGDAERVVICTSDIPFLTPEAVADFATRALATQADLVYPFVGVEECYSRFPGLKRTAISLREGRMTGGNLLLLNPRFMYAHRERIAEVYAARKSPLRLAAMLGAGTVARLLAALTVAPGALTVAQLEASVTRMLGGKAAGLRSAYPEIATDIDRPEDLTAALAAG